MSAADARPAVVSVLSVESKTVTIVDELPGRVAAFRIAEIRPQVGGIIDRRMFEQGSEVAAGQALFHINPDVFKADVDSASAALQRAEAILTRSRGKSERAERLIASNAISREAHEDAVAEFAQAGASVAEARATLQRRNLDLEFATVRAPISGRIGQALVSEGALVSASSTNALAVIQQIDRVYVDIRQPAAQVDVVREAIRTGQIEDASNMPVSILAASGEAHPVTGRALFSDISVDPATGNLTVRVEVENPDRSLLPGMYVRARLPRGVRHDALVIPQEAVLREAAGRPHLLIVDGTKHAVRRDVELGDMVDGRYVVTSGLQAGDVVVVQGQDRVQAGAFVETAPYSARADL